MPVDARQRTSARLGAEAMATAAVTAGTIHRERMRWLPECKPRGFYRPWLQPEGEPRRDLRVTGSIRCVKLHCFRGARSHVDQDACRSCRRHCGRCCRSGLCGRRCCCDHCCCFGRWRGRSHGFHRDRGQARRLQRGQGREQGSRQRVSWCFPARLGVRPVQRPARQKIPHVASLRHTLAHDCFPLDRLIDGRGPVGGMCRHATRPRAGLAIRAGRKARTAGLAGAIQPAATQPPDTPLFASRLERPRRLAR